MSGDKTSFRPNAETEPSGYEGRLRKQSAESYKRHHRAFYLNKCWRCSRGKWVRTVKGADRTWWAQRGGFFRKKTKLRRRAHRNRPQGIKMSWESRVLRQPLMARSKKPPASNNGVAKGEKKIRSRSPDAHGRWSRGEVKLGKT